MFKKYAKNTVSPELSTKSIPCGIQIPDLNKKVGDYFIKTYELYQKLFTIIKSQHSFYSQPQPLRHPLIFYFGHTACFYVNKLMDRGILKYHVNQQFQRTFAVGVDQNDWDDLDESHYFWPSLIEVIQYRNKVKKAVLNIINNNKQHKIDWNSQMWAVLLAIDHQRLHLQTSAVIIRRLPVQQVTTSQWLKQCPYMQNNPSKVPLNVMKIVPACDILYDNTSDKAKFYGWDSQFGTRRIKTKDYKASKMLVSNAQYFQFYLDQGYKNLTYWTQEGKKWLKANKIQKPVFWIIKGENKKNLKNYYLKTLTREISMPWDWPVQVNNLQARAFCTWKSKKTNRNIRLTTQDEYFAMRNLLKTDYESWQYQSVGNINLEFWCSPCPVNMFQIQGFCDIVGNLLQHTITPIYPFQNYKIHPLYEDFTTPSFDGRHDLIKGGCFINTGNSASMYYRTGFRRHFYLFTGFRYVESDNEQQIHQQNISQSDQNVKNALKLHFLSQKSYLTKILEFIDSQTGILGKKSLVVGCSVGRLPLSLSKYFEISFGIDYTARYFQMASRLSQKGQLSYEDIKIDLKDINLSIEDIKKVRMYQMNPVNTDKNKINEIDFMIVDGFNLKYNTIKNVLKNCFNLFKHKQKCHAILICSNKNNRIQQVQKHVSLIIGEKDKIIILKQFNVQKNIEEQKEQGTAYFVQIYKC